MFRNSGFRLLLFVAWATITAGAWAAGDHGHGGTEGTAPSGPIIDSRELTPDEAVVQSVLDKYALAMEQKSVELMEQAVIPGDFSTIESGYPNWSWEDFRDNHLLVEMDTFTDVNYEIKLIAGELKGALGFAVYTYTASGKAQGNPVSITGLGTAILEETSAGWRIHHLHTSAPRSQLEGMSGS
jgi:hypothetical protein